MPLSDWISDSTKQRIGSWGAALLISLGGGAGAGWGAVQVQQAVTAQQVTDLTRRIRTVEGAQDAAAEARSMDRERLARLETKIDLLLLNEGIRLDE